MTLDEIIAELLDQVKSRNPHNLETLHDVICEEIDKFPQIDTIEMQMDVAQEIISKFNF